jgi:hypothetical protein
LVVNFCAYMIVDSNNVRLFWCFVFFISEVELLEQIPGQAEIV